MKKGYRRKLDGPENVSPSGRPLDMGYTQSHGGATTGYGQGHGYQPGHVQVKHHPGRKSGHEASRAATVDSRGQPGKGGGITHPAPPRAGNQSATPLVVKQVGAQALTTHGNANQGSRHTDHVGKAHKSQMPPVEGHRNAAQGRGGMQSLRPQNMAYGFDAKLHGHQGRVMHKHTKTIKHMIGSRKQRDNY